MLNKELVETKMKERGFTPYSYLDNNKIHFISSHMYDPSYNLNTPRRKQMPIINLVVNLESDEFEGRYNVGGSTNVLTTQICGSVLNDEHFDKIVCKFESHAKCLANILD